MSAEARRLGVQEAAVMSADAHSLADGEEAVGIPLQVTELEGWCFVTFSWGLIALPQDQELADKLHGLIGKRAGIIRLDGQYRARALR